ncbi:hypothetical protein ATR1_081c0001, partial [Acetobacter tropicalis]
RHTGEDSSYGRNIHERRGLPDGHGYGHRWHPHPE